MTKKNRLFYERYVINDFTESQMKKIKKMLTAEDIRIINELRKHNQELYRKYPYPMIKGNIRKQLEEHDNHEDNAIQEFIKKARYIIPVFASILLIITGVSIFQHFNTLSTRMKGKHHPAFYIYQKTEKSYKQINNNSTVNAGDVLQLSYASTAAKRGCIFSVDGNRNITYHLPLGKAEMTGLHFNDNAAEIVLPYSYELDDAPDFEIFFFLTSEKEVLLEPIVEEILQSPDMKDIDVERFTDIEIQTIILLKGEK